LLLLLLPHDDLREDPEDPDRRRSHFLRRYEDTSDDVALWDVDDLRRSADDDLRRSADDDLRRSADDDLRPDDDDRRRFDDDLRRLLAAVSTRAVASCSSVMSNRTNSAATSRRTASTPRSIRREVHLTSCIAISVDCDPASDSVLGISSQ
jgi:hypothetical protein